MTINEPALQKVDTPKHIVTAFDGALRELRKDLLTMVELTENNLSHVINGLLQRDDSLCTKAVADDEQVDHWRKRSIRQLSKSWFDQPVASDLRQVVSAMKLSPNIERVADEATNIAEAAAS